MSFGARLQRPRARSPSNHPAGQRVAGKTARAAPSTASHSSVASRFERWNGTSRATPASRASAATRSIVVWEFPRGERGVLRRVLRLARERADAREPGRDPRVGPGGEAGFDPHPVKPIDIGTPTALLAGTA